MNKILLIGIDGGSFTVLLPLIQKGLLPNLNHLIQDGVSGELESVIPPVTAPAWCSFITGKNPGKHGVYEFMVRKKDGSGEIPINSTLRDGTPFWDILNQDGYKVLVLNIPTTYPPQQINGVMITDFLTPSGKRDFVYPEILLEEIEEKFGKYPLYFSTPIIVTTPENIERFLNECRKALRYKFQVARFLKRKIEAPVLLLHIWESDQICHWLWHILDPDHPDNNEEDTKNYQNKIIAYFKELDEEIGKMISEMGEEVHTFIISDHGFGPLYKMIFLNCWLMEEGYLKLKKNFLTYAKYWIWKKGLTPEFLLKFYEHLVRWGLKFKTIPPHELITMLNTSRGRLMSLESIDWSKTRAYAKMGYGQIYLNLKGREPFGIVESGEAEELRREIAEKLKNLKDPETGEVVGEGVWLKEELYHGKYAENAPDITFLPLDKGYLACGGFASKRVITKNLLLKGIHRTQGIFIAHGKAICSHKYIRRASIVDLAPTLLYLMGSKIPEDMDGRVMEEIFTEEFLTKHPIAYSSVSSQEKITEKERISEEESQELIKRLRRLGYLS